MLRSAWVSILLAYYHFRFEVAMAKYRRMLATGQHSELREAADRAREWAEKFSSLTLAAMA